MLLFYAARPSLDLDAVRRHGLQGDDADGLQLHTSLDDATQTCSGPVLVVDATKLDVPLQSPAATVRVPAVSPAAFQNLAPYRPPRPVSAGGGYVGCPLPETVALLLIHRRGVWDLPKGHREPGEDIKTCALREVREEIGVDDLHVLRALGTTQHGYTKDDDYIVKTSYWFLMRTSERSFHPQRGEGIRRVAWARWSVAYRHLGYDTLRRHMTRVEADVRDTFS